MKSIKWIIGYIDHHGAIHSHVVFHGDQIDSHNQRWPGRVAAHGKWRWRPEREFHLDTYNETLSDDDMLKIFDKIDKIKQ